MKKQYVITGVKEQNIIRWGDSLRDDLKIYSILHKGNRTIKIFIKLSKSEFYKIKAQLFLYNLKNKTKIKIKESHK